VLSRVPCVALLVVAHLSARGDDGGVRVTARSRSQWPGELVVLTITVRAQVDRVRARAFDLEIVPFPLPPTPR